MPVTVPRSLGLLPSPASHFLGSVRVFSPRSTSKLSPRSRRQFSVFAMAAEGSSLSLKSVLIIASLDQFPFFGLISVYPLFNSSSFTAKFLLLFFFVHYLNGIEDEFLIYFGKFGCNIFISLKNNNVTQGLNDIKVGEVEGGIQNYAL